MKKTNFIPLLLIMATLHFSPVYTVSTTPTYSRQIFYNNVNWWSGSLPVNIDSSPGPQQMTKCSVNGWFFFDLTSATDTPWFLFNQNGTTWDHSVCNTGNNYGGLYFDGTAASVVTSSGNCGGTVDSAFG